MIRNRNDVDCDTESEYIIVHFALEADKKNNNGEYYVCGQWNSYVFSPENKMKYDSQNGVYDASILLKQGYYNYSYLFVPKGEKKGLTSDFLCTKIGATNNLHCNNLQYKLIRCRIPITGLHLRQQVT